MAFDRSKYFVNGLLDLSSMKFREEYIHKYAIPFEYDSRPDLIALEIYGDISYQAFLTYYNRIHNPPEGYKKGRVIKFVDKSVLE